TRRNHMPRFIFLQYMDESKAPRPGSPEMHSQIDAFARYLEELKAAGAFKDGDPCQPSATTFSVTVRDDRPKTTDGPMHAESPWLNGYFVLEGLISIIPIVGWIALVGWLVLTIDHYRTGRRDLPPAGFHLERGLVLFVVYAVYAIVFAIPGAIVQGSGMANDNAGTQALGNLVSLALSALLAFLAPSIILHTYRSGFNGGFDVSGIWQMATSNSTNTIVAALVIFA